MQKVEISVFWFRRDLRLFDNRGLSEALKSARPVLCLFIFDQNILTQIKEKKDIRVAFIYQKLSELKAKLEAKGSSLLVLYSTPEEAFEKITQKYKIKAVYTNRDYEPYARTRDKRINDLLVKKSILFNTFKDQVIFEENEVTKERGEPYTVYTPYMKKWLKRLQASDLEKCLSKGRYYQTQPLKLMRIEELGFVNVNWNFPSPHLNLRHLNNYSNNRDYPSLDGTSLLGVHLRFGTVSVRKLVRIAQKISPTWLNELIWREFFMQILWHFPKVVKEPFRKEYEKVEWINSSKDFKAWCDGKTGYPLVDAGMRELNQTGYMHNRVRMVTASFLTKHLLIDWKKGERYFAKKLLDFDLAANNGNWQWVAGCGCDAAPYFRVFNPQLQQEKFDSDFAYIKKWVPEWGTSQYVEPIVDHHFARKRALMAYRKGLGKTSRALF